MKLSDEVGKINFLLHLDVGEVEEPEIAIASEKGLFITTRLLLFKH